MRYYAESDGHVYLVRHQGRLDLPTAGELPFPREDIAQLATPEPVTFCVPALDKHPAAWPLKDAVIEDPQASELARAAIHATMPRVVVEGLCTRDPGEILLVKGSRGFTAGRWSLPGGFVRFGERPEEAMAREIQEELGVPGRVGPLLTVRARVGQRSHLHWLMLFYRTSIQAPPQVDPDEIAEAAWCPRAQIADRIRDEVLVAAIEEGLARIR